MKSIFTFKIIKKRKKRRKRKKIRGKKKNILQIFEKRIQNTSTFLCRPSRKNSVEKKLEILTNVFGMHITLPSSPFRRNRHLMLVHSLWMNVERYIKISKKSAYHRNKHDQLKAALRSIRYAIVIMTRYPFR